MHKKTVIAAAVVLAVVIIACATTKPENVEITAESPQPIVEPSLNETDVAQAVDATLTALAKDVSAAATQGSPKPTPEPTKSNPIAAIPLAAVKYPGLSDAGWTRAYVWVAIENTSSEYQFFETTSAGSVVTEEGYSYPGWCESTYCLTTGRLIPPGFRVLGHIDGHYTDNMLVFRIAEGTTPSQLRLPGVPPISLDDIKIQVISDTMNFPPPDFSPFSYAGRDLTELFPTGPSAPTVLQLGDLASVGATGEMTLVSSARQGDSLTATMLYRNNSDGYAEQFRLAYSVIGDDGILRSKPSIETYREVGPAQEVPIEVDFSVPVHVKQLKLIVLETLNVQESRGAGVFSLE